MARFTPLPESPFQAGRRLNARELVDREVEVRDVLTTLLHARTLFVIGPRRHGKTSILHVAMQEAEAQRAVVLAVDAEAFPTVDQLAAHLLAEATRRLEPRVQRAQEAVSRFFGRLRPTVTFNPADQSMSASLGVDAAAAGGALPLLIDVLNGIEQWAAQTPRPVAVVIDEVQELLERESERAERQFRAAVQQHEHVGYVFAGSRTHYLARLTQEPGAPFFNLGARLYVGAVPDADFRAFLTDAFARGGFAVTAEAITALLDLAERVPYNVQLLADACWRALATQGPTLGPGADAADADGPARAARPWGADDVRATVDAMVRTLDPLYSPQWTQLTGPQRAALQAFVYEGAAGLTSQAVLRRYRVGGASSMQRALGALEEKGVLFADAAGGHAHPRLQDPFFGRWVRTFVVAPGG